MADQHRLTLRCLCRGWGIPDSQGPHYSGEPAESTRLSTGSDCQRQAGSAWTGAHRAQVAGARRDRPGCHRADYPAAFRVADGESDARRPRRRADRRITKGTCARLELSQLKSNFRFEYFP